MINKLRNELLGKELTWGEIENTVNDLTNRLDFDKSNIDTIFNNNKYIAFELLIHSYEISASNWLNISFDCNILNEPFDIYNDTVKVTSINYM